MKIWSAKSTSLVESSVIDVFNLHFINNTCSYSLRHWASYIPICYISHIWQIPKSWFDKYKFNQKFKFKSKLKKFKNQYLKMRKKEKDLGNFKMKYLKLYYKFRAFIRYTKTAIYRPVYQKFLMCPLIKTLGQGFVSKMRPIFWKAQPSFRNTRPGFWGFKSSKTKTSAENLKSSAKSWKRLEKRGCAVTRPMLFQSATGNFFVRYKFIRPKFIWQIIATIQFRSN